MRTTDYPTIARISSPRNWTCILAFFAFWLPSHSSSAPAAAETTRPSAWKLTELVEAESVFVVRWEKKGTTWKVILVRVISGNPPKDITFLNTLGRATRPGSMSVVAWNGAVDLAAQSVGTDGKVLVETEASKPSERFTLEALAAILKRAQAR